MVENFEGVSQMFMSLFLFLFVFYICVATSCVRYLSNDLYRTVKCEFLITVVFFYLLVLSCFILCPLQQRYAVPGARYVASTHCGISGEKHGWNIKKVKQTKQYLRTIHLPWEEIWPFLEDANVALFVAILIYYNGGRGGVQTCLYARARADISRRPWRQQHHKFSLLWLTSLPTLHYP